MTLKHAAVQGGLDPHCKVELEDVEHWLHCLQSSQTALVIFETVEDAIADIDKAEVTFYITVTAAMPMTFPRLAVVQLCCPAILVAPLCHVGGCTKIGLQK